jgi:hypothetical protein
MTTTTAETEPHGPFPPLTRILAAAIGGGAVDFVYACIMGIRSGRGIEKVWQGVASGWIGKAAGEGGWATAALGMVTHFGIATVMAATYALVATRAPILYRRWPLGGLIYGLILYGVMYGAVLPLRFGRPYHWAGPQSGTDILAHLGVGLVIAMVLSRGRTLTPRA